MRLLVIGGSDAGIALQDHTSLPSRWPAVTFPTRTPSAVAGMSTRTRRPPGRGSLTGRGGAPAVGALHLEYK
jgi:hypothetical protein